MPLGSIRQPLRRSAGALQLRQGDGLTTILEVNSLAELEEASNRPELQDLELQDGARGRVTLQGPGLGLLADGFAAEQVWGRRLVPTGAALTDVSGEGFSTAIVDFRVPSTTATAGMVRQAFPIAFLVVLVAIIGAIKALGWLVNKVTIAVERIAPAVGGAALAIAVAVAVVAAALLLGGRRPRERTLSLTSPTRSAA